ncbi:Bacteriophage P2-related tail formation protein [Serratia quinivorans]|uniref:Bacteriophage P2-related tail formation protein n=1 Tax=Serratia quinivorans TaxID=137545 RepID=A0A380AKV7_9GAMM|nr:phage tail protein I [Serratia proteamaculans]RYM55409.1 phage tail protein I [Serratia proteamaculans]SUI82002.1 Bacteriophage P2-related tail formation protein [Serratia quinivorans]
MTYRSLLPPNASQQARALEGAMRHVGDVLFDVRDVKNPDACPAALLPWLAWEFGVTWWDDAWTAQQKRDVIKSAAAVNKKRGTPGAVKQALASVDRLIDVIEWFRDTPQGEPYTFRAVVHGNSVSTDELQKIFSHISDAKNARSFLRDIRVTPEKVYGKCYIGGGMVTRQSVTIKAKRRDE